MSDLGNDTRIKKVSIKEYNLKELAGIYNVSKFRLRKKMKPYKEQIGKPEDGYSYDVKQVALIFSLIDLPSNVRLVMV